MSGEIFNLGNASLTDTGQWKLIVDISATGIDAILKNVEYDDTPLVPLFRQNWEENNRELLEKIETSIYDNPRILEDFATLIIVTTPKSLWIPAVETEDEEFDDKLFTAVYPASREDISADFDGDEVCLYTLVPGLNSFLHRTLPGCRVSSQLSLAKEMFERIEASRDDRREKSSSFYTVIREGNADIFFFRDGKFQNGVSHEWRTLSDLIYKILLVADANGAVPSDSTVTFFDETKQASEFAQGIGEFFGHVRELTLEEEKEVPPMSLAMAIAAGRQLYISEYENNQG